MSREWRIYIADMIEFCEHVILYTKNLEREKFEASRLHYDATVRNIELIGEAARHIPDNVKAFASEIEWRRIIATRNQLIHVYAGIDNDVLWEIVRNDIPSLLEKLMKLKQAAENQLI